MTRGKEIDIQGRKERSTPGLKEMQGRRRRGDEVRDEAKEETEGKGEKGERWVGRHEGGGKEDTRGKERKKNG